MAKGGKRGRKAPPRARQKPAAPARHGDARLELAMRAINEGVYDWDVVNGKIHYSERVYSVLHMPRSVKTPADWRKRIHPDDLAAYDAAIRAHFQKKTERFECDYRYRARDRSWRWARQHGIAMRDTRGRAVRMIGSTGDISELKRIEQALQASEERYAFAMRAINEGVYDWNIAKGTVYYSERVHDYLGLAHGTLRDAKDWVQRIHPDDLERYRAAHVAHFKGATPRLETDYRYRDEAGAWRWARTHGIAVRDATGRAVRVVGSTGDITELKLGEIALRRARDKATEALERQTATAEILKVIASSPSDVQPVFDTIARNAVALCDGLYANVFRFDGELLHLVARHGGPPISATMAHKYPMRPDLSQISGRAMLVKSLVYTEDTLSDPDYDHELAPTAARRMLGAPMLRDGNPVGAIVVGWAEPGKVPTVQQELLQTFADQAVIAIENVRLFNETKEALERQTATAEILKVIASSPSDVQPVFDAVAESAARLCAANDVLIRRVDGNLMPAVAHYGELPVAAVVPAISRNIVAGRAILESRTIQVHDVASSATQEEYPEQSTVRRDFGYRTVLAVPLVRKDAAIGVIIVRRLEVRPFADKQIELLKTFADQSVIAIENVRLFNETKEALERQTATAEILKVIASSPSSVQPVFDAIARSAMQLIGGFSAAVVRVEGDALQLAALTSTSGSGDAALKGIFPLPISGQNNVSIAVRTRAPRMTTDVESDPETPELTRAAARARGWRAGVAVPMLRDGLAIGAINVTRRDPGPFADHHVKLLQTFADQAVIAIHNVRLFNETKEALERQTATAEILKVIASSPSEVQPVFEAILRSATRLCSAERGLAFRYDGEFFLGIAAQGLSEEARAEFLTRAMRAGPQSGLGRILATREPVQVADVTDDEAYRQGDPLRIRTVKLLGARTAMWLPLLKDDSVLGAFAIYRQEVRPFTEQQVDLVQTFASQAVIAIENVRLFNETKEALAQQTATAEILRVIGRSITDTKPVFDAIVNSCHVLFNSSGVSLRLAREGNLYVEASVGDAAAAGLVPIDRSSAIGACMLDARAIHLPDLEAATAEFPRIRQLGLKLGFRSGVYAPLLRGGAAIGTISVLRRESGAFSDKEVALLKTFADQAVIAIENVRLFNETKEALERQTATGEILSSMSGSMTDAQPVFDAIARNLLRLFGSEFAIVTLVRDGKVEIAGIDGVAGFEKLRKRYPVPLNDQTHVGKVIVEGRVSQLAPIVGNPAAPPSTEKFAREFGYNAQIGAPMIREGKVIGAIVAARRAALPFDDKQIALIRSFADQAVIAIENVRLFNETKESLERQTATAEILKVIASSPSDVQPVFDAIVGSCQRLFGGHVVGLTLVVDGRIVPQAAAGDASVKELPPWPLDRGSATGACVLDGRTINIGDVLETVETYPRMKDLSIRLGYRSGLWVPLRREGSVIGCVAVVRRPTGAFTDQEVALAETFADQAVIAIENVRLFNETKEALEQQTATSGILEVMSGSPTDVQPVFDAIVRSGARLFSGAGFAIALPDAGQVRLASIADEDPERCARWKASYPFPLSRDYMHATAILDRREIDVPDALDPPAEWSAGIKNFVRTGYRAITIMPLTRGDTVFGTVSVVRMAPGSLTDKQIAILKTFADQAVIAIENVRLFNETREALERQTATAEILRVIGGSMTDTQPVFEAIVKNCGNLFKGSRVALWLIDEKQLHPRAANGEFTGEPMPIDRGSAIGVCVLDGHVIHLPDLEKAAEQYPRIRQLGMKFGYRSGIYAPLMREGRAVGGISVLRRELGAFDEKEMALLNTFADQAVIAIENVRLFKELQQRTEALTKSVGQLTALGEVGQAISSTLDLDTVLKAIVARAVQLSDLDAGVIYEYDPGKDQFLLRASERFDETGVNEFRGAAIRRGEGAVGRSVETREPVQIPDTHAPDYPAHLRDLLDRSGFRALLAVPLLREDQIIGALMVIRRLPGEFAAETVEMLKTFAGQSALAIQNARLFREIAEKGRQLEEASQHKSQFLASMSHELRTPLNAILGFNEMILGQVYGEVPQDMQEPLTDIQTSGKHLLRLINNVLDLAKIEAGRMELALQDYSVQDTVESVRSTLRPLAAEKGLEFLVTVPNEVPLAYGDGGRMTQCLMNLAGNSLKFTKAGKVEIAVETKGELLVYKVSDTGIGIPPDKVGGLFTEFKQTDATIASEYGGTGLGLSISKKFVEMHGGRIWVESELGKGSTFIIEIPLRVGTA